MTDPSSAGMLRAGPLEMSYRDGDLRYISAGGREIVRRIYVAARDRNWGAAPNRLKDVVIKAGSDAFRITFVCENLLNDLDFAWRGTITGRADGTITYAMDGVARATFMKNRIGFCVLHPAACAGAECDVTHSDGARSKATLPRPIIADQPVRPFEDMRVFSQRLDRESRLDITFEGDVFEMEDQRNWTDASYKTFGTPLRLPFPVEVKQGARVRQTITLRLVGVPRPTHGRTRNAATLISLTGRFGPVPAIGLGLPADAPGPSKAVAARLRMLELSHLRADIDLRLDTLKRDLGRARTASQALGLPLELALRLPADAPVDALIRLRAALEKDLPKIARVLAFREVERQTEPPPISTLIGLSKRYLADLVPNAAFGSGVNTDFLFLNRYPASARGMDALSVAIHPQAHAFDDLSLIETLETQGTLARNLGRIARGLPFMISPVTLLPRFNPYATASVAPAAPPADPRQRSAFGACWTLGSLKYLAEAGVSSVTCFETHGPRGVMDRDGVFPMFNLFAAVGEYAGGQVVASKSTRPLVADALVLRDGKRFCALIANFSESVSDIAFRLAVVPARVDAIVGQAPADPRTERGRFRFSAAGRSITRVIWPDQGT